MEKRLSVFTKPAPSSPRRAQFIQVIERGYSDPSFKVQSIAESLGVSVQYVYELSKNECRANPHKLIETLRILHALRIILTTNKDLMIIAKESGYANYQTFRKACRKRLGLSPSELRDNSNICSKKKDELLRGIS